MSPAISVIMPVHDGEFTLDRAIRSVIAQQFADWEIVAVDDGSSDDTPGILQRWSAADCRIHFSRFEENRGVAAARNAAIETLAQGEMIAFLDRDDEYYPSYLNDVQRLADRADMLVFGYDYVYEDGPAQGRLPAWNPAARRQRVVPAEHRHAAGRGPAPPVVGEGWGIPRELLAARLGLLEAAGPGRRPAGASHP